MARRSSQDRVLKTIGLVVAIILVTFLLLVLNWGSITASGWWILAGLMTLVISSVIVFLIWNNKVSGQPQVSLTPGVAPPTGTATTTSTSTPIDWNFLLKSVVGLAALVIVVAVVRLFNLPTSPAGPGPVKVASATSTVEDTTATSAPSAPQWRCAQHDTTTQVTVPVLPPGIPHDESGYPNAASLAEADQHMSEYVHVQTNCVPYPKNVTEAVFEKVYRAQGYTSDGQKCEMRGGGCAGKYVTDWRFQALRVMNDGESMPVTDYERPMYLEIGFNDADYQPHVTAARYTRRHARHHH